MQVAAVHLHFDARCLVAIGIQIQEPFAAFKYQMPHLVWSGDSIKAVVRVFDDTRTLRCVLSAHAWSGIVGSRLGHGAAYQGLVHISGKK